MESLSSPKTIAPANKCLRSSCYRLALLCNCYRLQWFCSPYMSKAMPHKFRKNIESICHSICVMCLLSFQSSFIRHVWFYLLNNFASSHVSRHLTLHLHSQYSTEYFTFYSVSELCIQIYPIHFAASMLDFETDMNGFGCGCPEENRLNGSPTECWSIIDLFLVVFIGIKNHYIP